MRQQRQQVKLLVGNLEKKRDRAEAEEHTGWREGLCLPGFARSLGRASLHFHLQLQRRRNQVLSADSPACLLLRCLFVCLLGTQCDGDLPVCPVRVLLSLHVSGGRLAVPGKGPGSNGPRECPLSKSSPPHPAFRDWPTPAFTSTPAGSPLPAASEGQLHLVGATVLCDSYYCWETFLFFVIVLVL